MAQKKNQDYQRWFLRDYHPLAGRMESLRLRGPTEVLALAMLWENFLCRMLPNRELRARMREDEYVPAPQLGPEGATSWDGFSVRVRRLGAFDGFNGQWGRREIDALTVDSVGVARVIPDRVWHSLFGQTLVGLNFQVHAALWAPFADCGTGTLPNVNLDAHIRGNLPEHVTKKASHGVAEFLLSVTGGGVAEREWIGPHLRLRVEPPALELRDRDKLLHCMDGPAVVYPDGTGVYFWRGVQTPPAWLPRPYRGWRAAHGCAPPLLPRVPHQPPEPAEALQIPNVELRRVACELLGWDAILTALRPGVVDRDPDPTIGTLLLVHLPTPTPWGEGMPLRQQFLRVQCGTGRTFALAVPPTMRTARQANAWTYGLDESDYAPEVRT